MMTLNRVPSISSLWVSVGLLLLAFGLFISGLTHDSFWLDEGYSAWVVHDTARQPDSLRDTFRAVRDSLLITLERTRSDVHPPLYYLLLDGWSWLAGHSDFALRLPSTLLAALAVAGTLALGRLWRNWRAGWLAVLIVMTQGFLLYYARDARMYGLYLALAVLATLAYSFWWRRRNVPSITIYTLLGVALLYTHYTAFTVLLAHALHTLLTLSTRRHRWSFLLAAYGVIGLAFVPWLPILQRQFQLNTGFAAPGALAADWGTAAALYLVLTSGYWGIFGLALLVSRRLPQMIRAAEYRPAGLLILLWGLLPPAILLGATAYGLPIFQLRYVIVIVPAGALLIGLALSETWFDRWRAGVWVSVFFAVWIAYTQLMTYRQFWPEKPRWRAAVEQAAAGRNGLEPALVYADPRSPLMHYDRQLSAFGGIRLNLHWRGATAPQIDPLIEHLDDESIWLIAEMAAPASWEALHALSDGRGVGYRDSVQGTIFYRFDSGTDEMLAFTFGDALAVDTVSYIGEGCVAIRLSIQDAISADYALGLSQVRGYNEVIAQTEIHLPLQGESGTIEREICLNGASIPVGDHLRLMMYELDTRIRLPLLESGLLWGDYLLIDPVER